MGFLMAQNIPLTPQEYQDLDLIFRFHFCFIHLCPYISKVLFFICTLYSFKILYPIECEYHLCLLTMSLQLYSKHVQLIPMQRDQYIFKPFPLQLFCETKQQLGLNADIQQISVYCSFSVGSAANFWFHVPISCVCYHLLALRSKQFIRKQVRAQKLGYSITKIK